MKWLIGFVVAFATVASGMIAPASALTCTAPGHDTCTITCPVASTNARTDRHLHARQEESTINDPERLLLHLLHQEHSVCK